MKNNNSFKKANQLWFDQGRTAKSVVAYQQAMQEEPNNPVVAFQYARVLWSLDRYDEARFLITQAQVFKHLLSALGKITIDQWNTRLQQPPVIRLFPQFNPDQLDRDQLDSGQIEVDDWLTIADAANAREMYGLALYALQQWGGNPIDAEDMREMGQIETNCENDNVMLAHMLAKRNPEHSLPEVKTDVPSSALQKQEIIPRNFKPVVNNHDSVTKDKMTSSLPDLPLILSVNTSPLEGQINEHTTLIATLSNPTQDTIIVNSRLLINHRYSSGEIWLELEGPKGYQNSVGFRVRPGRTPEEFYVPLALDQIIEQSWILNDYYSLDMAGEYKLKVIYHNECDRTPNGLPMSLGKVVGITQFNRHR